MYLLFRTFWALSQALTSLVFEAFVSLESVVFHLGFIDQQVCFFFSFFLILGKGEGGKKNESLFFQNGEFWSVSESHVG